MSLAGAFFGAVVWIYAMRFSSWLSEIEELPSSESAAAFIPWLFAVGLTPGVASFASLVIVICARRRSC